MKRPLFEGNRILYQRYLLDENYPEVHFDIRSGGVSAVHRFHRFDQEKGPFGIKRGDYERAAVDILRRKGYSIILESERAAPGVKTPDGKLNGSVMDIKAVESAGRWAVKDKLHAATKQGVTVLVLYFPNEAYFSKERVLDGWKKHLRDDSAKDYPRSVLRVVCVVGTRVLVYNQGKTQEKPPAGDFSEGSKETGGVPLSPSMQRYR